LSQINPAQTLSSYFIYVRFNVIFSFTPTENWVGPRGGMDALEIRKFLASAWNENSDSVVIENIT
jgi:hypothetical protein